MTRKNCLIVLALAALWSVSLIVVYLLVRAEPAPISVRTTAVDMLSVYVR